MFVVFFLRHSGSNTRFMFMALNLFCQVNDTAMRLFSDTQDEDQRRIADLVIERMEKQYPPTLEPSTATGAALTGNAAMMDLYKTFYNFKLASRASSGSFSNKRPEVMQIQRNHMWPIKAVNHNKRK